MTAAIVYTSLKSYGSSYATTANAVLPSDFCRRSEILSEMPAIALLETLMTDAKTHWCLIVFRCVNCGKNEAFAEDSFEVEPSEDQIRTRIYQAICRFCGWEGEVRGMSAVEMRSGVERRTGIRNKQRNRPVRDS